MDSSRKNETGAHRKRITRRLHQWSLSILIICSIAQIGNSQRNESNLEYDNYNSSESNEKYSIFVSSSSDNEEDKPSPTINPVLLRQLQKNPERIIVTPLNDSKDGLAQDGSEQKSVVFVADSSGYVPITQFRGRPKHEYRESWDRESRRHRSNFTRVQHIEAECQDDYMKIRVGFNGSFTGLLYSSGYSYDPDCVYINGTGRDYYEFYIQLNRCGTLGKNSQVDDGRKSTSINKNFMWNTITVQYNPLIEEEWDEHFKVTCEYGYDFWKTVTFPFLDVEVATGNPVVFTLSPPECYMEIRYGYGTSGTRVTGPVRVGDPLTLIIYMRSKYDGFDIVVNDCFAHNGATKKIQLIDQYGFDFSPLEPGSLLMWEVYLGCPVDDKLISRFRGSWSDSGVYETQVFAYMKTFRFTGSPALYIECDVRMCHGRCPNQPCHWRNSKSVSKRSTDIESTTNDSRNAGLSENINLFQSLRVLQEGETVLDPSVQNSTIINSVCLKYSAFSTILGFVITILCLLISSLTLVCIRLRKYQKSKTESEARLSPKFDHKSYMIHKGRIN